LLDEVARLEKQLAATATVGSTRDVVRLLDRLHEVREQVEPAVQGENAGPAGRELAQLIMSGTSAATTAAWSSY
jgi:hypothetical protein